jgi:hypothetical protein
MYPSPVLHQKRSLNTSNNWCSNSVDRLIDAISGPLSGEHESDQRSPQRSNSKGSGHSRRSAGNITSSRPSTAHGIPGKLARPRSYGAPEHLRSPTEGPAGSEFITDNRTVLKAIRMPDEYSAGSPEPSTGHAATKVLFDIPDKEEGLPRASSQQITPQSEDHLQILVAEDDPINSRIIKKKLEKSGHEVYHTINGEECAGAYSEKPTLFDVVLMDMQVSISSQDILASVDSDANPN